MSTITLAQRPAFLLLIVAFLLTGLPIAARADTLLGKVIAVQDGDTLTILDMGRASHRIRLAGIDAPERGQPFSERSRRLLADLTFGKSIAVEFSKRDRYGRVVGKVLRLDMDICLNMLHQGMAWHFKRYEHEQSREDRLLYAQTEQAARVAKRGLWSDPKPIPPWAWRTPSGHHDNMVR